MRAAVLALIALAMLALASCQPATVAHPSAAASAANTATATLPSPRPTLAPAASSAVDPVSGLRWVDLSDLPAEASDTVALIESDGPFPFSQDGVVFQNREGILPSEPSDYYREYTVQTPGSEDRAARRIVAGREGELYYTDDHYNSFSRIRQ